MNHRGPIIATSLRFFPVGYFSSGSFFHSVSGVFWMSRKLRREVATRSFWLSAPKSLSQTVTATRFDMVFLPLSVTGSQSCSFHSGLRPVSPPRMSPLLFSILTVRGLVTHFGLPAKSTRIKASMPPLSPTKDPPITGASMLGRCSAL